MLVSTVNDAHYLSQGLECLALHDAGKLPATTFTTDSTGFPEGGLQRILPVIRERYANPWFVNYIPTNPITAPGMDKLTYPRISYYGNMTYSTPEGNLNEGRVDVGIQNVEYAIRRPNAYFEISNHEAERVAGFLQNNNAVGAISLLAEKRMSAEIAWVEERDRVLCKGVNGLGLLGFCNHPDILRITLTEAFPSATPSQNIRILSLMAESIVGQTNGTYLPTTLVVPPTDYQFLINQERSNSSSDTTTLRYFVKNRGNVMFDDGERPFEVGQSAKLENAIAPGVHAAIMFCRQAESVEQITPKPLTMGQPIPVRGGYQVECHGDVTSLQAKQPHTAVVLEYSR